MIIILKFFLQVLYNFNLFKANINYIYVTRSPINIKNMRKKKSSIKRKTLQKKKKKTQIKNSFVDDIKLIQKKTKRESELSTNSESNLTITNKPKINNKKGKEKKEKRNDENIKECPICNWRFPNKINSQRIKIHINKCLDGYGEKDITKYENFTKYNQINFEQCNEYENCPICNKIFYTFSEKVKFIHIKECLKKFEKNYLS